MFISCRAWVGNFKERVPITSKSSKFKGATQKVKLLTKIRGCQTLLSINSAGAGHPWYPANSSPGIECLNCVEYQNLLSCFFNVTVKSISGHLQDIERVGDFNTLFWDFCNKLCFETKSTKLYSKILLVKSSENSFVFLPVFYLIMWLMKALKNFGKIAILKIWELIS